MRTNGTLIYPLSVSTPQFDKRGVPITGPNPTWSGEIPCHIKTLSSTSNGRYEDGTFHQASYEVLVERNAIPTDCQKVKLVRRGVVLGEFQIQGYPEVINLDRIKFTV